MTNLDIIEEFLRDCEIPYRVYMPSYGKYHLLCVGDCLSQAGQVLMSISIINNDLIFIRRAKDCNAQAYIDICDPNWCEQVTDCIKQFGVS